MVLEGFVQALQYFGQLDFLVAMIAGTVVGIIIGIIPAIGGTVGLALVLPLVFAVPAHIALPFMVALWATTATGGAITSILLNIPGTPELVREQLQAMVEAYDDNFNPLQKPEFKGIRKRSLQVVVDEIEYLIDRFGIGITDLVDCVFPLTQKMGLDFADQLIGRGLHKKIAWGAEMRVDYADDGQ